MKNYNDSNPFEMEITASDSRETEADRLVRACYIDICNAMGKDRLEVETPRGHVEQTDLQNLGVGRRDVTDHQHGQWVRGPTLITIEFGLSIEHEGITTDLSSLGTDVVVYGDLHVWRLANPWSSDVIHSGWEVGEEAIYEHSHEWGTVEEIDWR
jgi:hypothetical protein